MTLKKQHPITTRQRKTIWMPCGPHDRKHWIWARRGHFAKPAISMSNTQAWFGAAFPDWMWRTKGFPDQILVRRWKALNSLVFTEEAAFSSSRDYWAPVETQKPVKGKLEPLLGKTLVSVRVYRTSSHSNRHVYALRFRHTHETPKCQTPPSTADMQMPRMSDARHQGQLSSKYPGCQTHVTKDSCRASTPDVNARHQGQLSSKYPGCQRTSPRTAVEKYPGCCPQSPPCWSEFSRPASQHPKSTIK